MIPKPQTLLRTCSPWLQAKRFRGKINIQRPRQPHYERALIDATSQPIYPETTIKESCLVNENRFKTKTDTAEHKYEEILAREVLNWFNHSKFVGIFHMNSITEQEIFSVKVALHKHNIALKTYGRSITNRALIGTKFETILPLLESKFYVLFSPELKVSQVVNITKKVPQMVLMAGIVENTLLNKNEVMALAAQPSIEVARAQLVGVLDRVAQQFVGTLEHQQKMMVLSLDAHAKSGGEESSK